MARDGHIARDRWKLVVCVGDQYTEVMGTKEILDGAVKAWTNYIATGEQASDRVYVVQGYYDSADRADLELILDLDQVVFMRVLQY